MPADRYDETANQLGTPAECPFHQPARSGPSASATARNRQPPSERATTRPTAGGTMLDGQRIGQARLTSCPAAATPSSDSLDRCRQHFARTERLAVTECSAPERAKRSPLRAAPWQRSFSCSFSSLQGRNDRSALAIFELDNAARSRHLELFATLRRRWRIGSIACSISWRAAGSYWRLRFTSIPMASGLHCRLRHAKHCSVGLR